MNANETQNLGNFSEYTVSISREPSYYGSTCSQDDANRIAQALEGLIQEQFPGVQTVDHYDGRGSGRTTGPDDSVIETINDWIANNWTAAL